MSEYQYGTNPNYLFKLIALLTFYTVLECEETKTDSMLYTSSWY